MASEQYEKCWKFAGSPWKTEAAWLAFLRGAIRRAWNRHPIKIKKLMESRIRIPNPKPKGAMRFPTVWGAECECCRNIYPLAGGKLESGDKVTMQVDHINPAGSLRRVEDVQGFFERMFCVTMDDLRLVCSVCNKTLALAEKQGWTFDRAAAERFAIDLAKRKVVNEWLEERGIIPASTAAKRRAQVVAAYLDEIGKEST